jgi:hypothetical protein
MILAATTMAATLFNGLLYAEMQPTADAMAKRGQRVEVQWHDQGSSYCPRYSIGHSMGAQAALRQAAACAAAGHPPVLVITIDPARTPAVCPPRIRCINYYNPSHPIGGQFVTGAKNIIVTGYDHLWMPAAVEPRVLALTAQ